MRRYNDSCMLVRIETLFGGLRIGLHGDGDGASADSLVSSTAVLPLYMYVRGRPC